MPDRTHALATLKELEADSGIDITTLYRACAPYGDLPCIRLTPGGTEKRRTRGSIRVKWSDWDAWLEQRRIAPPDTPTRTPARAGSSVLDLPGADRYSAKRKTAAATPAA